MPIYVGPYGATSDTSRTGYYEIGGTGSADVVSQSPPPSTTTEKAIDPFHGPGSIDFDLTDPQGAADKAASESGDVFTGLKAFLFGTDKPDIEGHHGGILGIGDVPLIGDALRFTSEVGANVVGGLVGAVAGTAGSIAERIPFAAAPVREQMVKQFNELPEDSQAKKDALEAMEQDKGFLGTGILSADDHYMAQAIADYDTEKNQTNLWQGLFKPTATVADAISNLFFGGFGASQRFAERAIAGAGRPGSGGLNQLEMIMAVGDGHAVWTADDPHLTPAEQIVYDNYSSGKWSPDQALDFMASHGLGLAHSKLLEIAGSIAVDPLNVATLGAGALAKLGSTGVTLVKILKDAREGLAVAKAELASAVSAADRAAAAAKVTEWETAVEAAQGGIRSGVRGENIAARDVLGKLATQQWTGDLVRRYGEAYAAIGATSIGRIAKATRTIIDPMSALGATPRAAAAVDEGSREVAHAVVRAHGEFTHMDTIRHLGEMDGGSELLSQYEQGLAIYSANALRRVVGRSYRAAQMLGGRAEALINELPFQPLKDAMAQVNKRALTQLEEEAVKFIKRRWTEADKDNLAERLATLWQGRTKEQWVDEFANVKRWTPEKMSLLHAATYGTAVRQLHDARAAVIASGEAGAFTDRLRSLILINKQSLTDLGAEGIETRLGQAAGNLDQQIAIIEEAKRLYPELRNFVSDPTSKAETVNEFMEMLQRRKNHLPAQIRNAERAQLPASLADFDERTRNVFTIGFRPKDEFLWGLERDPEGVLREVGDPWFDQVSSNLQGYMPVRELSYNAAGKPIPNVVVKGAAKMLDAIEAAGKMAAHGVTGAMVAESARSKFVANVLADYEDTGLSQSQVEGIWQALMKKVDDTNDISGIRGLSPDAIWKAAKDVVPDYAKRAGLDRRSLLIHVMDAYDGDVRHIGVTQKFTGKAKLLAAELTGQNSLGMISEHVWPLLKFRLNPFFQLQEKIEPWVLNAQRGAMIARGTKMNEIDHLTAELYRNFMEKNLIRMSDTEIAELAAKFGWGKGMERASVQEGGRLAFVRSKIESISEVQGVKQLNMLRTFQKGLGREVRAVWEQNLPGEWDRMLAHERALAGTMLNEDEFAVRIASSNIHANRVFVDRMIDDVGGLSGWRAQFQNAIQEGQWSAPQSLGELRALDLEHMADRLSLTGRNGETLNTSLKLREALASGNITIEDITRGLRDLGAHPDYIQRVDSAYRFSWSRFWPEVQRTYGLTDDERRGFENLFAGFAHARGMTPVEYISQVYSPSIVGGLDHSVGSLGNLVEFTRSGVAERIPDLARLAGQEGQSTIDDLYRQMGAIMSMHLDPSAKRAFLLDINDSLREQAINGQILTDIREIEEMWNSGGSDALSQRIMNFIQGQPGTGAHTFVADETTGIEAIRNAATEWRSRAGRPRNLQRVVYDDDPALAREVADAFDQMPASFAHVATPADLRELVRLPFTDDVSRHPTLGGIAQSDVKAEFRTLPKRLQDAYEAYALESRKLYRYALDDLGIEIVPTLRVPYTDADALRQDLAAGRLTVQTDGYWHPIFKVDDLFMQRVVRDIFGYGQEAVPFGSHDGIMNAAALYSDEARSIMLSDEFGRTAWEAHNPTVIEQTVAEPRTVAEYENRWGKSTEKPVKAGTDTIASRDLTRAVGLGVKALPEEMQTEMISTLGSLRNQFPDVSFGGFDVAKLDADTYAATLTFGDDQPTIVFSPSAGWEANQTNRSVYESFRRLRNEQGAQAPASAMLYGRRRVSALGTPTLISSDKSGDIYHEFGHVVDWHMHKDAVIMSGHTRPMSPGVYVNDELTNLMDAFKYSRAVKHLSEYATTANNHPILTDSETFAELFDLAFNPKHSEFLLGNATDDAGRMIDSELRDYAMAFRRELESAGYWKPNGVPAPVNPHAGMTVAEVNALARGGRVAPPAGYRAVSGSDFHAAITRAANVRKSNGRLVGETVYVYPPEDYASMGTFLSDDGLTGYAIKPDGDLVSVFNVGAKGRIEEILPRLPGQGATKLDAFDESGRLPDLYAKAGFREVRREPWNPAYAPPGWTGGTPDVVYMERPSGPVAPIRAEHRVGLLPQPVLDKLTSTFIGSGRFAESNPDVARLAAYLHEHMQAMTAHVLREGEASGLQHFFDVASGMPVTDAVPYNFTEGRLWDAAVQSMATKWEDAFRLQYFAQNRSMFQRSLNHPMFGLYPASYMWGKVGPEMIRFIAAEPFGMRTGGLLYSLADLQKAVAVQRQYDPDFDKTIDDLGSSASLSFLGYLLPAIPWSVPSSYPAWMRDMAQQGLANNAAVEKGKSIKDDNFVTPLQDVVKKVMPVYTNVPWAARAAGEVGSNLPWNAPKPKASTVRPGQKDAMGNVIGSSTDLSQPVNAVNTQAVLENQMRNLQALLSGR